MVGAKASTAIAVMGPIPGMDIRRGALRTLRFRSERLFQRRDPRREHPYLLQIQSSGLHNDKIEARVVILNNLRQQRQARNSLRCDDAMLGQMCAKGIDKLRSLTDEEVSRPEKHGAGLLGFRLWNDEPHRRPGRCFNDRFCIGRIILLPFDKGLNVGRRDQANIMAKFADLTRPIMRGGQASIATMHLGSSVKKVTTWPRDSCLRKTTLPSLLAA